VLQSRIHSNIIGIFGQEAVNVSLPPRALELATFAAYRDCFRGMAVLTAVLLPGIFLFRIVRADAALRTTA